MTHSDLFIAWLNDAHALEKNVAETLGVQIQLAADLPIVQGRLRRHLDETLEHARVTGNFLESLGASAKGSVDLAVPEDSGIRLLPGKGEDDLVKAAMVGLASEYMEIATYTALIVAAHELGHTGMVSQFERILAEERAMAAWIETDLPVLASDALLRGELWEESYGGSASGE
jgi:ferritin-like metal-binding protein YciE